MVVTPGVVLVTVAAAWSPVPVVAIVAAAVPAAAAYVGYSYPHQACHAAANCLLSMLSHTAQQLAQPAPEKRATAFLPTSLAAPSGLLHICRGPQSCSHLGSGAEPF